MKRPTKTVTSIGVIAVIVGLAAAGISTVVQAGANPILVFIVVAALILVLGVVLDNAARNAMTGPKR
jgi:hypothetical protein